ncbi:ABC transporter substrate-binding protein [Streptomyces fradiae]|uniref:ABC transporter substrate-binding protein n=1 Tax=Streptomyces fradiae TaxID=1906 RepID=UPI003701BD48
MMTNGKIGAALVGGYLLGRTKKAKLAAGLAMALAGSRVRPAQLGRQLAQSPFLGQVNQQVRGELATAGKAAAATVLNAKAERLAEALHERTENLREETAEAGRRGGPGDEGRDAEGRARDEGRDADTTGGGQRAARERRREGDGDEGHAGEGSTGGHDRRGGQRRRGNGGRSGSAGRRADADSARRPDDG